jgi:hypothetical protein
MTDAIAAITSSTISDYGQISPAELADFESAYQGEEIQFSSISSIDETKEVDLSDRLFHHIMEIDDGYHRVFSNNLNTIPEINGSLESNALQNGNTEPEYFDFSSLSMDNLQQMIKSLHEVRDVGLEAMAWSMRLKLLITTGTTMTKGLGSLLKG